MAIKQTPRRSRRATSKMQSRLLGRTRWPAIVFAVVVAIVGGVFIWRSFADPLTDTPQTSDQSLSSDFNKDGKTSLGDMSRLLAVYGSQDKTVDLNGDGVVDLADISILLAQYAPTVQQQTPATAVAPQPVAASTPPTIPSTAATPSPAPKPTPAPTPPADTTPPPAQEVANEVECPNQTDPTLSLDLQYAALQCMNAAARRFHGLTASHVDAQLMQSAAAKATDVANCEFSHTACGREVTYWFIQKKFTGKCYAENLGQNQKTVRQVFMQWMDSPPHREDILKPIYVGLGVAVVPSDRGLIWVQHFGGCY